MLEVSVYALLGYWTVRYFDLQVDWEKKSVSSKTGEALNNVLLRSVIFQCDLSLFVFLFLSLYLF